MNTLVAVAIAPFGVGDELAPEVAEVVRVIRESGLPNKTYSMFTEIEGEWDEVMAVVRNATFVIGSEGHPHRGYPEGRRAPWVREHDGAEDSKRRRNP